MAFSIPKRLKEIAELTASAAAVVTNAASTTTIVKTIVLYNHTATAKTVTLWNVPDSTGSVGTAADANEMFEKSIPANDTVFIEFPGAGLVLEDTNDTLQAKASSANSVTIQVYGIEDV